MSEKILQYFYRSVKNLDNGEAEFCDVYQVLPGGASTALFYSVTDDFDEICKLNAETFKVAAKYARRLYEREYIDELRLCFSPCVDFISSDESFKKFLNLLAKLNLKNDKTVLFFDTADIYDRNKEKNLKNLRRLKSYGVRISVGGYGSNINLMDVFSDLQFDYFRVSAAYVLSSAKSLSVLSDFCRENDVKLIADGVSSVSELRRLKQNGVALVCGDAVSEPKTEIDREYLGLKPLTAVEREKYVYKLKQDKILAEQQRLVTDGKKLLKQARHGAIYESDDYIVADGTTPKVKTKRTIKTDNVSELIGENKLPKEKQIKLDESGKRIKKEFENSLIESIYALLADDEVKDKERRILRELELAKKRAKAAEEEKFVLAELEAFIKKTEEEKRNLCLARLVPALRERINYLIKLDALAIELEQLEIEEKIEAERKEREEAERRAAEEKVRLEQEKIRLEEERKKQLEELYVKEKARLEFEYELSIKKSEAEAKIKAAEEALAKKKAEETQAKSKVKPMPNEGKVVEAVAYDDIFLPAEIEEEVSSYVFADAYVESDGTLKQELPQQSQPATANFLATNEDTMPSKTIGQSSNALNTAEENEGNNLGETASDSIANNAVDSNIVGENSQDIDLQENARVSNDEHHVAELPAENEQLADESKIEPSVQGSDSGNNDDAMQTAGNATESSLADLFDATPKAEIHGGSKLIPKETSISERAVEGDFIIDLSYDDGDGHYNDKKQWVDSDGEVYDGYFDQQGRWIDYGYYDDDDNWHDNGFYDGELFIPYGYFDDDGNYIKI